jgi:hypothetical protein
VRKIVLTGFLMLVLLAACSRLRPQAPPPPTAPPAPIPGLPTSAPVSITPRPTGANEPEASLTVLPSPALSGQIPSSAAGAGAVPANRATVFAATQRPTPAAVPPLPGQQITITLPPAGSLLASGGQAAGWLARIPPDNVVSYRVYGPDGHVIGRGWLAANGTPGEPGRFAGPIRFAARTGRSAGQLEVLQMSPDDGSILAGAWTNVGFGMALPAASGQPRAIAIQWPLPGTQIAPGDEVMGNASVLPMRPDLAYRVYDQGGYLVGSGPVTLERDGGRGTFVVPINYTVEAPGPGRVQILDQLQADGRWLAAAFLNVSLVPGEQAPIEASAATGAGTAGQPALGGLPLHTDLHGTPSPAPRLP